MNEEDTMFSSVNENLYSVTKSRSSFSSSSNSDYQLNNNSPQIKFGNKITERAFQFVSIMTLSLI